MRVCTSARVNWVFWNWEILRPNWMRSFVNLTASSMAPWAMPTACAPTPMRPPSSVAMAILKPLPSAPEAVLDRNMTLSNTSSQVEEGTQAHLVLRLAHGEARHVALEDEGGDAPRPELLVGHGEHDEHVRGASAL